MRSWVLLPLSTVVVAAVVALPGQRAVDVGAAGGDLRATPASAVAPPSTGFGRVAAGSSVMAPADGVPRPRGRWAWPLSPRPTVVRPFLRPATSYGAGHRGIDLAGSSGQVVSAVDAGTVTHVGRIGERSTVTVLHASGVRSTYEPLDPVVTEGQPVSRGMRLGSLASAGSHCAPACLHLGAVRGDAYLDPLVFLEAGRRVRLLPLGQPPDG